MTNISTFFIKSLIDAVAKEIASAGIDLLAHIESEMQGLIEQLQSLIHDRMHEIDDCCDTPESDSVDKDQ